MNFFGGKRSRGTFSYGWVVVGAAALGWLASALPTLADRIDPTDDFSFTLSSTTRDRAGHRGYRLMGEARIAAVLRDRLTGLASTRIPALARHLRELCRFHGFDPAFVLALIQVESSFRVAVRSSAGAVGLMQLMPDTADRVLADVRSYPGDPGLGDRSTASLPKPRRESLATRLEDPFTNLSLGVAYLASLRERYRDRSPYTLVAAYAIGPVKMDELLARKTFRPVNTKRYYEAIRRGLHDLRFYRPAKA